MSERDIIEKEQQEQEYNHLHQCISGMVDTISEIKKDGKKIGMGNIELSNIEILRNNKESEFILFFNKLGIPFFTEVLENGNIIRTAISICISEGLIRKTDPSLDLMYDIKKEVKKLVSIQDYEIWSRPCAGRETLG